MDGSTTIGRLLELAGVEPRDSTDREDGEPQYQCLGCGSSFDVQYHVCPECGGFSVEHQTTAEFGEDDVVDDSAAE